MNGPGDAIQKCRANRRINKAEFILFFLNRRKMFFFYKLHIAGINTRSVRRVPVLRDRSDRPTHHKIVRGNLNGRMSMPCRAGKAWLSSAFVDLGKILLFTCLVLKAEDVLASAMLKEPKSKSLC